MPIAENRSKNAGNNDQLGGEGVAIGCYLLRALPSVISAMVGADRYLALQVVPSVIEVSR